MLLCSWLVYPRFARDEVRTTLDKLGTNTAALLLLQVATWRDLLGLA
jgi:hypothetical protein